MNTENWMRAIKDEVKLTKIVIPSAHNAGTKGMNAAACCQDGDVYEQFIYGIRHFCIRLDTDKKGRIVVSHGLTKGQKFEDTLKLFRRMLLKNDSEFFIFDIREYYPQKFGPVTVKYRADAKQTDELIRKYLEPEKYALWDFDDIRDLTMGDIRKAGKRYLLINYKQEYTCSVNPPLYFPWDKQIYGCKAEKFSKECIKMFDDEHYKGEGLFWFQMQRTPNLGTEIGFTSPRKLEAEQLPYYTRILDEIKENPVYLDRANIIAGDFMTSHRYKCKEIIYMNLLKNQVREDKKAEFGEVFGK